VDTDATATAPLTTIASRSQVQWALLSSLPACCAEVPFDKAKRGAGEPMQMMKRHVRSLFRSSHVRHCSTHLAAQKIPSTKLYGQGLRLQRLEYSSSGPCRQMSVGSKLDCGLHWKKKVSDFPVPSRDVKPKLSLAGII
jgi:hypothetical protein